MAGMARAVWRRAQEYVKYDIKEILVPSSMPNPPGYVPPPPRTLLQSGQRFVSIVRRYIETWDSEKLKAEVQRRQQGDATEASGARQEEQQHEENFGDLLAEFGGWLWRAAWCAARDVFHAHPDARTLARCCVQELLRAAGLRP